MRRNKEIMILLALLLGMIGFVSWYVIDRRAKNKAQQSTVVTPAASKKD